MARLVKTDENGLAAAAAALRAGGLVAVPTETVYGLAADATDIRAVGRIYAAKGRPEANPLIVHVADLAAARALAQFDPLAERLAAAFWPGPLTLVLPRSAACPVCEMVTAGLDTIAVRVPAHPAMQDLLARTRLPLAAPSANRSGRVSATTAAHVAADLGDAVDVILDGGPCPIGIESTILACRNGQIELLRPGGLPLDRLRAFGPLAAAEEKLLRAPGMMASHYAPRAALRLAADAVHPGEALLGFGRHAPPGADRAAQALNLSASGDLAEAATNLFAYLRRLDETGASVIAVAPIPDTGLGLAINDRLARAAAPRPEPVA